MPRFAPFLAGFAVAAGLAAAGWFLRIAPAREIERQALADAKNEILKERRTAADRELYARAERDRAEELRQLVAELQRPIAGPKPPVDDGMGGGHDPQPPAARKDVEPEKWDRNRLNQEVENLTKVQLKALFRHPRLPLVVRGVRAHGDEGIDLLQQIVKSKLDAKYTIVAAVLGGDLGDARLVPSFFERWRNEPPGDTRFALMRALAKLPGEEIVPGLVQVWTDTTGDAHARGVAIEGLGRRGIDLAVQAAVAPGAQPALAALRFRAMIGLRDRAEAGGWKDPDLVALFGHVLLTADGERQRRLAMLALEGFWNAAAAKHLAAFAEKSTNPTEAASARKTSDAILAGTPRPAGAGVPERALRDED